MASHPRYAIIDDNCYFHVTWKCHNNAWLLKEDWAKGAYWGFLIKYKKKYKIQLLNFCFMSNHPHLLGYCENKKLFSDFFRVVNSQFAKLYNKRKNRRGQVVMDRFKSPRIQSDADLIKVMQYIELNPKRAKMVRHPKDYKWSSYGYYAYGQAVPGLDPAPSYLNLGRTPEERQRIYREMVEAILRDDWKEKRPYSSTSFIGNPDWVIAKMEKLRGLRREKYKSWLLKREAG